MELLRALGALAECPNDEHVALARSIGLPGTPDAATYTTLFSMQLFPYASVYVGAEGMLGGEARDRVAGFWRAVGLVPPPEADHLTTLLAMYSELRERREEETDPLRRSMLDRIGSALLWEHVLPWVPQYAQKAMALGDEFYAAWGAQLERALAAEALALGVAGMLPLHLREAPPLPDPREEGARPFIAALLAPVRSGFIIARDDLARAARSLGLGLRQGERRFVLESLFAQERVAVLGWLEREALAAAERHRASVTVPTAIRDFWISRASRTAQLLQALREAEAGIAALR